ncbi:MAG TPA: hypothetical protein VGK10_05545 [Prolixibacteraceae bacterium]
MRQFVEINFEQALDIFQDAEMKGLRWRLGDFITAQWLQRNTIHLDDIVSSSKKMPDVKVVIIGEGPSEGFYIYSPKLKTCYKFEHSLAEI